MVSRILSSDLDSDGFWAVSRLMLWTRSVVTDALQSNLLTNFEVFGNTDETLFPGETKTKPTLYNNNNNLYLYSCFT